MSMSATNNDDADDEKLGELFNVFETTTGLVYSFTILRNLVRLHDLDVDDRRKCKLEKVMNDKEDDHSSDEKEMDPSLTSLEQISFDRPELIITDKGSIKKMNMSRNLMYPVTVAAIKLFLDENRKYFVDLNDGKGTVKFNTNWRNFGKPIQGWFGRTSKNEVDAKDLYFQLVAEAGVKMNQEIVEYDDTFVSADGGGLVQGLIVNKTKKWLSVIFRGTAGNSEWGTNFNYNLTDDGKYGDGALIHQGFANYLMGKRSCDATNRTYLERIIASINYAYEKNPEVTSDYKLFISGHSLGGALATMTAFHFAHLKEQDHPSVRNFPKKIRAVTFAAPLVGNFEYNVQYERLEKDGFLRHVRFTNEGDVVPTRPILFGIQKVAISGTPDKFEQNGMNVNLSAYQKATIGYRITKSAGSQISPWSVGYHALPVFKQRWDEPNNEETRQLTVKELYKAGGVLIN